MARPKKERRVRFKGGVSYFKPRGIPMKYLEEVTLTVDECEAIRLSELLDMSHEEAGRNMEVSRATFGRIIKNARRVVADALINGKAIRVEGGDYKMTEETRDFFCLACDNRWEEPGGEEQPSACPSCGDKNVRQAWDEEQQP